MVLIDSVVISSGAGFPGHSRVLEAILKDSLELNVVIRAAGDVNHNCWGYENSNRGIDKEVSDVCQTRSCQTGEFLGPWCVVLYISRYPCLCSLMMISQSTLLILRCVNLSNRLLAVSH